MAPKLQVLVRVTVNAAHVRASLVWITVHRTIGLTDYYRTISDGLKICVLLTYLFYFFLFSWHLWLI